jgi:hypothetical protein
MIRRSAEPADRPPLPEGAVYMKAIAQRFWNEPSVAIGLFVSLILLVFAIISGDFDAGSILGILGPLISALGIRQFVTPTKETSNDARDTGTAGS